MGQLARLITGHPAAAVTVGGAAVGSVGAGIAGVLILAGVPTVQAGQAVPAAIEEPAPAPAAWQETPAGQALLQALTAAPGGWAKEGEVQRAVTPPFPYSCPQPGTAPAVSLAQTYSVNGARIQVITQAYTAGAGAEAMSRQLGNAGVCSGSDGSATVSGTTGAAPGVESHLASTNRGNVRATVISSRRGDVITHIVGPPGAPMQALGVTFDNSLSKSIQGKCAHEDSKVEDATRSPWAAAGYKPFTQPEKVSIAAAQLPDIPAGTTATRVELPGKSLDLSEVKPSPKPAYPVWPVMPDPLQLPEAPEAPQAKAPTETAIDAPAEDKAGPGCGWAFTGMKAPTFDPAAAAIAKTNLTLAAMSKLNADAKKWQSSVLDYWVKFAAYEKAATAYKDYSKAVSDVNAAWAEIGKQWDAYNDRLEAFRKQTKARADFLTAQKAASADYDKATAVCNAPQPPAPTPTPSTAPTASGQTPPPQVTAPQSPRPGCPAQKPDILGQPTPEVMAEPTPPADPRPKA